MTNTADRGASAGRVRQARLVIPTRDSSMAAKSNTINQTQTTPARLDNNANVAPKLAIKQKCYAGVCYSDIKIAPNNKKQVHSHGNNTVQPLGQNQAKQTVASNKKVKTSGVFVDGVISSGKLATNNTVKNNAVDHQVIAKRAAQLRRQAKIKAEAAVRNAVKQGNFTDMLANMSPVSQQINQANPITMSIPTAMSNSTPIANPVNASAVSTTNQPASSVNDKSAELPTLNNVSTAGAIAVEPSNNLLSRIASTKITISFNINKQRVLSVLRYLAVAVIIIASAYLAWDTYTTNQSVRDSFTGSSSASAMSIAGTNPATADQTAVSQEQKAVYAVPADQPRMISIPAIGVNARVLSVGVNSSGNIDTPANLNDTAWYDGSAKPGQSGQVFIDGHTSFSNSINAAFNNLPKLKEGDEITIEKGNGEWIKYSVVAVETKDANDVDMGKALNTPEGVTKGLTLMTCTGTFNYHTQTADKRLIVYAVQKEA